MVNMQNLFLLFLAWSLTWGISILFSVSLYKKINQSQELKSVLENTEMQLSAYIHTMGINDLKQTRAGHELLRLLSPESFIDTHLEPPLAVTIAAAATPDVSSTLMGDMLRLFSVVEEVQAGSFEGVGAYPNFLGYVEMSQCQINGVAHYVVNLRGTARGIKISWDKNYGVIKVNGDSMNARGVDDGDYVLLHFQWNANNGDIVLSQIMTEEAEATLKLFLKRENKTILQFCSHNPAHKEADGRNKEYHFSGYTDEEFQIVGVAIAVFKPLKITS